MQPSTSGALTRFAVSAKDTFFTVPSGLSSMTSFIAPAAPGFCRACRSKQQRNPSRFDRMSSVSGSSRSLAPASFAVMALLSGTPLVGGSLVISLISSLQSAAVRGAGFGFGASATGGGAGLALWIALATGGASGGAPPPAHAVKPKAAATSPTRTALAVAQARMARIVDAFALG